MEDARVKGPWRKSTKARIVHTVVDGKTLCGRDPAKMDPTTFAVTCRACMRRGMSRGAIRWPDGDR